MKKQFGERHVLEQEEGPDIHDACPVIDRGFEVAHYPGDLHHGSEIPLHGPSSYGVFKQPPMSWRET